MVRLTIGVLA